MFAANLFFVANRYKGKTQRCPYSFAAAIGTMARMRARSHWTWIGTRAIRTTMSVSAVPGIYHNIKLARTGYLRIPLRHYGGARSLNINVISAGLESRSAPRRLLLLFLLWYPMRWRFYLSHRGRGKYKSVPPRRCLFYQTPARG